MIERDLFFELLHKARQGRHIPRNICEAYLIGYRDALRRHLEDIKIAANMEDYWKCQQSGAE